MFTLYQMPGWGSAIVEMQLAHYGIAFHMVETGDLFDSAEARAALERLNPRGQIPTLVTPTGTVMTESAAITLHLADIAGIDSLVPGPMAGERAAFLRWLIFIVANIYPCHTFADVPGRFVPDAEAAAGFRANVDAYHRRLWLELAGAARGPWFLGARFSAIDLYLAAMTNWRPGRAWFAAEAPLLAEIGQAAAARPEILAAYRRNFVPGM